MNDDRTAGRREAILTEARKLASFGAIGALNGVVNYLVTVGLVGLAFPALGVMAGDGSLGLAKGLGWLVAVSNSYVLNSLLTFAEESERRLSIGKWLKFMAFGTAGLVAEVVTFLIASRYLPLVLAGVVPIAASFLVNFTVTRLFVFPKKKSSTVNPRD